MAELLISVVIALLALSSVVAVIMPAGSAFQTQPEAADVEQRLRASADPLVQDLLAAGSVPSTVLASAVPPVAYASVLPMRIGRRSADPPGTYDPRRITVWFVAPGAPQARLSAPLQSASGVALIALGAGCTAGDPSCGFRAGMLVAAFAPAGAWDLFSITGVQGPAVTLQHNLPDSSLMLPAADTTIAEVTARTYQLKNDAGGSPQLIRYDAAGGSDAPVAEHVVALRFEYLGDPDPPAVVSGTGGTVPLRVTYGPPPPGVGVQQTAYPPGENCAFARGPGGAVLSRLPALGSGPGLVPMTAAMFTDGPWCPDAAAPGRYDADLLRIRHVAVSVAVEAAVAAMRGFAGPLFTRGGTARDTRWVPDRVARLVVAPRALNAVR